MSKELLKDIIRLKLKVLDCIIENVPGTPGEKLQELQRNFLLTIREVLDENQDDAAMKQSGNEVKKIAVE